MEKAEQLRLPTDPIELALRNPEIVEMARSYTTWLAIRSDMIAKLPPKQGSLKGVADSLFEGFWAEFRTDQEDGLEREIITPEDRVINGLDKVVETTLTRVMSVLETGAEERRSAQIKPFLENASYRLKDTAEQIAQQFEIGIEEDPRDMEANQNGN